MSGTVVVSRRGADRIRFGHPWVYQSDILRADAEPGDIVRVLTARERPLGSAFWSSTSQISGVPVAVLACDVPERVETRHGGARFSVDLRHGQKTGLFLDQRENHHAAGSYARGRGLDAFTYSGGFALPMAWRCETVLAID